MALENFPIIEYSSGINIHDYYYRIDIIQNYVKNNITNFFVYNLEYGDTPESVSMKFYGTPEYWYLILMANNIQEPFYEWILTDDECMMYARTRSYQKYGCKDKEEFEKYLSEIAIYDKTKADAIRKECQKNIDIIYTNIISKMRKWIYLPNKDIVLAMHKSFEQEVSRLG